jgi:hypothetical protein
METNQTEIREGPLSERDYDLRHDAAAPERFAQPVADLGTMVANREASGIADFDADASDHFIIDGDGEVSLRYSAAGDGDPLLGVLERIRMRDHAHVAGDAVGADVLGERSGIRESEGTNGGFRKGELHAGWMDEDE